MVVVYRCRKCGRVSTRQELALGAGGQLACLKCNSWHESMDAWLFEAFDLDASTAGGMTVAELEEWLKNRDKLPF